MTFAANAPVYWSSTAIIVCISVFLVAIVATITVGCFFNQITNKGWPRAKKHELDLERYKADLKHAEEMARIENEKYSLTDKVVRGQ